MRRLLLALITSAWIALLAALVLPLPWALFADGVGSAAMTPLFYGLWAAAALWMYRLASTTRMGRASLLVGAVLTFAMSLLALWPPFDRIGLAVAIGALLFAGAQVGVAYHLESRPMKT
jgi:hypothetical protein